MGNKVRLTGMATIALLLTGCTVGNNDVEIEQQPYVTTLEEPKSKYAVEETGWDTDKVTTQKRLDEYGMGQYNENRTAINEVVEQFEGNNPHIKVVGVEYNSYLEGNEPQMEIIMYTETFGDRTEEDFKEHAYLMHQELVKQDVNYTKYTFRETQNHGDEDTAKATFGWVDFDDNYAEYKHLTDKEEFIKAHKSFTYSNLGSH